MTMDEIGRLKKKLNNVKYLRREMYFWLNNDLCMVFGQIIISEQKKNSQNV